MTTFTQTYGRRRQAPTVLGHSSVAVVRAAMRRIGAITRSFGFREVLLVVTGYIVYFLVRGQTQGSYGEAAANSHRIVDLEKAGGFFWEPAIQRHVVDHQWIVDMANGMYIWGHWPLIASVAVWLLWTRRETFTLYRTAFFISGAIGVAIFMAFPVAPPRLADIGLVDTVTEHSNAYRVLQPSALTNQYAAVPSLHFGWDLLIGIALVTNARWLAVRVLGAVVPVLMFAAIVLTANHYIFDAIVGGAVALTGLGAAYALQLFGPAFADQFRSPYQRNVVQNAFRQAA
jgi:hypothetical protein